MTTPEPVETENKLLCWSYRMRRRTLPGVLLVLSIFVVFGVASSQAFPGEPARQGTGAPQDEKEEDRMSDKKPQGEQNVSQIDIRFFEDLELTPEKYSVSEMLAYKGPSSKSKEPIAGSLKIADFRSSEANEKIVDTLFSSEEIPFFIVRDKGDKFYPDARMVIEVPKDRFREALSILAKASEEGVLERVEGNSGLIRWHSG